MSPTLPALSQEWITLQNNHERYETGGLILKLAGMAIWGGAMARGRHDLLANLLVLILWAQEGVYRTFQARLGARILRIEALLSREGVEGAEGLAFQLHSEWLAARPGVAGLLAEYGKSALRPTVVFPYAVLLLIGLGRHLAG
jgi:hypothetical protein